nr:MAG TPA: hypothetical protein [Caudoviricetes sp.]
MFGRQLITSSFLDYLNVKKDYEITTLTTLTSL